MRTRMLVWLFALCFFAVGAWSAPLPACQSNVGLDVYLALGSTGCTIDDKIFSDFTYSGSSQGGASTVPASGITVTALDIAFNPGFLFNAGWSVGPGQSLDSLIQFNVTVMPGGGAIKDISASMVSGTHPNGIATVAENVTSGGKDVGDLFLFDNGGVQRADTHIIMPPVMALHMSKDISVNGHSTGSATISAVEDHFSEVPEPAAFILLGSALAALGFLRPRSRRA